MQIVPAVWMVQSSVIIKEKETESMFSGENQPHRNCLSCYLIGEGADQKLIDIIQAE